MTRPGLSGNLKTMSLPDLLQWASRGTKTGTLVVRNEPLIKEIYFQDGSVIGSYTNDPREYLGQLLLSEGAVTEEQLKDSMKEQSLTKVMLGRIMVKRNLVSEAKIAQVLRMKAEETIYSLFLWNDADFEFRDEELPPGEQIPISIHVEEVLLEGLRRFDTTTVIRESLPSNNIVLAHTGKPLPQDIAAKPFPNRIYELVDGRRTVSEIILEAHGSEFNVCQVLHVLLQLKYLKVCTQEDGPRDMAPPRSLNVAPQELLASAREMIKSGNAEKAIALLEDAREAGHRDPTLSALMHSAEQHFVERAYQHYLPLDKIPVLRIPLESLADQDLRPEEVFLASRVNGSWDVRSIMTISPLREVDALRALKKLRERGIIELVEEQAKSA